MPMTKYIYSTIIALAIVFAIPQNTFATEYANMIEQEQQPVVSLAGSSNLHVQNANGMTLYIYNVAGVIVQTIKVTGQDVHYDLNLPKGCYIVKVGKTVRKISVS